MKKLIVFGLGLSLLATCLYLVISVNKLQKEVEKIKKWQSTTNTTPEMHDEDEAIELAVYMSRLQLYTNKLWFAAKNKSWELASFYLEETKETMEEVVKCEIMEEGIRISEQMNSWGLPAIAPLQKAIESKELKNVELEYNNLINHCNGCHIATKHGFIKIKVPESQAFTNQLY